MQTEGDGTKTKPQPGGKTMIRYGLAVVGILLTLGILWPTASSLLGTKPNEATRLVEAAEHTNNKADSLNRTFTDVIPPGPPGEPYRGPLPSPPLDSAAGGGTRPLPESGPEEERGPVPTPTPDRYAHPSEHAVRDAMEYLNKLQTEMQPTQRSAYRPWSN